MKKEQPWVRRDQSEPGSQQSLEIPAPVEATGPQLLSEADLGVAGTHESLISNFCLSQKMGVTCLRASEMVDMKLSPPARTLCSPGVLTSPYPGDPSTIQALSSS